MELSGVWMDGGIIVAFASLPTVRDMCITGTKMHRFSNLPNRNSVSDFERVSFESTA